MLRSRSLFHLVLILIALGTSLSAPHARLQAQSALDTVFPWPRWNGVRVYGLGAAGHADVDPDLIVFDDTTHRATVTLVNPLTTAQPIWIAPECGGDGRLQPDDPLAATWKNQYMCAAAWVSGYPQYLVLPPHTRRTLTLELHPYPTLPDGRYIARLMLNGIDHGMGHDETAIVYHKGPAQPRRSHAHWVETTPGTLIHAKPAELVLDETTRTATVTFRNPEALPAELWLMLDCPWFRVHYDTVTNYTHKSQYEMTWHLLVPNIVTWLNGLPQHMILAPHEERKITLTLQPFLNGTHYPRGSYYAALRYVQAPVLTITAGGDTTFRTPTGLIPIVYHQGGAATRLVVNSPEYVRHSDGTGDVCVTVRQPGIGVVVLLHAELRDIGRRSEQTLPHWSVDTTVGVWEVKHGRSVRESRDQPIVPVPICVPTLPISPGRFQAVISVRALGGVERRLTLPIASP